MKNSPANFRVPTLKTLGAHSKDDTIRLSLEPARSDRYLRDANLVACGSAVDDDPDATKIPRLFDVVRRRAATCSLT